MARLRRATDELRVDRPVVVQLNRAISAPEAVALLSKNAAVIYTEPDYIARMGSVPNDPNYNLQWHHQNLRSEAAWDVSTGSSSVIVAVLDSGLDYAEERLAFQGRSHWFLDISGPWSDREQLVFDTRHKELTRPNADQ